MCEICLDAEATGLTNIDPDWDNPNEWLATCGDCARSYARST